MGPDFIFLGYASPRQINYMAKMEIFRMHPLLTKLFTSAGVFPIRRGQQDMLAIETAIRVVRDGKVLGMFPEGTRSRNGALIRGKSGVARIAREASVPVVPTVVINAPDVLPNLFRFVRRPLVTVRFGEPILWDGNGDEAEALRQFTRRIMLEMAALLPENLRGEYAIDASSDTIPQDVSAA
jgi:1-acyl-sn-glycerol-3-phosphate acyltransferase